MGNSSTCSWPLKSDSACYIEKCQRSRVIKPEWSLMPNVTSYTIELKKKMNFQGTKVSQVVYTVFFRGKSQQQAIIHLCSFIQKIVEQGVCPFIVPVYSLAYNCRDSDNVAEPLVVIHGMNEGDNFDSVWHSTSDLHFRDKQFIVFQLLYVCYVLQLAHFPCGLQRSSLYIVTLEKPVQRTIATNDAVFQFTTPYELEVAALPVFFPNKTMETIRELCEEVNVTLDDTNVQHTLVTFARQLDIVVPNIFQSASIGMISPYLKRSPNDEAYRSLRSFHFPVPNVSAEANRLRELEGKRDEVRAKMREFIPDL